MAIIPFTTAKKELAAKIQNSKPVQNMKKILLRKNEEIRGLRSQLLK
jgi:hypothetical protein